MAMCSFMFHFYILDNYTAILLSDKTAVLIFSMSGSLLLCQVNSNGV
jgi:hypothetical protein